MGILKLLNFEKGSADLKGIQIDVSAKPEKINCDCCSFAILFYYPSELHFYAIVCIQTLPNLDIRVLKPGKSTAELQRFYPSEDIVIEISAEVTSFMDSQIKFITNIHANGAVPLFINNFSDYLVPFLSKK